jgi:hypothetical protein
MDSRSGTRASVEIIRAVDVDLALARDPCSKKFDGGTKVGEGCFQVTTNEQIPSPTTQHGLD